jgi:hypothetical protein
MSLAYESFEGMPNFVQNALRHGHVVGVTTRGSEHERVRQVTAAFLQLGRRLQRAR